MTSIKKRIIAALTATILSANLTIPTMVTEAQAIRVSSYKGSTLEVGERSGLIIGPSDANYTITSSDPDTVTVEQVLTFWVAVAKSEGTAEITASNSVGEYGSVTLMVDPATTITPEAPTGKDSAGLTDNLEIRQEMIQLINQTRKDNGVSELPVNDALMNAAQACSNRHYTWHHAPEESQAAVDAGYCFEDLYTRRGLSIQERELITFCAICCLGGCGPQAKAHAEANLNVGNTKQILIDALTQCLPFIGFPRTLNALACL